MTVDPRSELTKFRDTLWRVSPPWLMRGTAARLLYTFGVMLDAGGDAMVAGVKLRFPGVYSMESLALIGRERRIRRGRYEADTNYAARLLRWREDHSIRGGAYALLRQLYEHYAPNTFPIELVYASGGRFSMAADGTITYSESDTVPTTQWARWQLLYITDTLPGPEPDALEDLITIPREWIAAHCLGEIVVVPDGELWNFPPENTWNESGVWNTAGASVIVPVGYSNA